MLVDLGLACAIVALAGDRADDRALLGGYVDAAAHQRRRNFWVIAPLGAAGFLLVSAGHGWPLETRIALAATIVAGLWVLGWVSLAGGPLSAHREMRALYRPQTVAAAARLVAIVALHLGGRLTAVLAQSVQVAATWWSGRALRRSADRVAPRTGTVAPERLAELRRYLRPLWPALVFASLQAQVLVVAASVLADERSIAEVGALSRLTQLLTFFIVLNAVVIAPAIARTPAAALPRRYAGIALLATTGAGAIVVLAFAWPDPFMLLLGDTYADLRTGVGLAIAGSALAYLDSLVWTMNSARRWVFGWHTTSYIVFVAVNQVVAVVVLDLTTTNGLLVFALWTNAAILASQLVGTAYGFARGAPPISAGRA